LNRNITIVIIILILVVIAGYLVWLRSRYMQPISPGPVEVEQEIVATPTASPIEESSPSAKEEEATEEAEETATPTPASTER
jgi:cytoskeletal protein RodZ